MRRDELRQNTYNEVADQYAHYLRQSEQGAFSFHRDLIIPNLLSSVGNVAGPAVLDAGCGEGVRSVRCQLPSARSQISTSATAKSARAMGAFHARTATRGLSRKRRKRLVKLNALPGNGHLPTICDRCTEAAK
jgi:hypothetical protein